MLDHSTLIWVCDITDITVRDYKLHMQCYVMKGAGLIAQDGQQFFQCPPVPH